jgi:2-amino-4-hydroxy-6-hydroxymethyldihydropteridine diphosphokinase
MAEGELRAAPALSVPHERLRERAFALLPLRDAAPDARDPVEGDRYADLLVDESGIRLAPEPL